MSSFRRRTTVAPIPGTRPSSSSSLPLISTGLATFDDLLGGGLPLSTSLLLTQDHPTTYSDLVLRYFIAQGLESDQDVLVVGSGLDRGGPRAIANMLMGTDRTDELKQQRQKDDEDREDQDERKREQEIKDKMKIAFRYESMKQHQTTLDASKPSRAGETDMYCSTFDLTTSRPLSAKDHTRLHYIDVDELPESAHSSSGLYDALFQQVEAFVAENGFSQSVSPSSPRKALRIAISSFGSPSWGPSTSTALYGFLHRLRSLHRRSNTASVTTFPAHLYPSTSSTSGPCPLLARLSHASDSVMSLTSFALSPTLSALYPRHSGLLTLPKLPSPGSLVPPSTKLSLLRNLGGGGQGRENLLGFRVKRRRFIVEVVSEEPEFGDGPEAEEDKRKRERKRRVDEANRKEREAGKATDVLLSSRKDKQREGASADAKGNGVAIAFEERGEVDARSRRGDADLTDRVGAVQISSTGDVGASTEVALAPPIPTVSSISSPAPTSSAFKKKRGVRMGGVSFQGEDDGAPAPAVQGRDRRPDEPKKKVSISAMLHREPELLDF